MPRMNFTQDEQKVFNLALDLARNDYESHTETGEGKVTKKDLENYLRKKINDDILKGRTLFQAFRKNSLVIFEIVEEIVNVAISENVLSSPFIDSFVEVKNRDLGDTTAFYSEGGLLTVASFAGNHWDTNREAVDVGEEFTLPKEWIYCHVYEELERFLMGITPLEKLIDKVYKSINKYIQDRLYAQFQNVATAIPTEFSAQGNSEAAIGTLVDKVQAAGGYNEITIAGTKGALRKLTGVVPDKVFADSQKEANAMTGSPGVWEGNKLMVIPQTLKSGTFELALDDTKLFILGADCKPIKLEYMGDVRSDIDTEGKKNNDMTVDFQVQVAMGMGLVLPPYAGVFTFA